MFDLREEEDENINFEHTLGDTRFKDLPTLLAILDVGNESWVGKNLPEGITIQCGGFLSSKTKSILSLWGEEQSDIDTLEKVLNEFWWDASVDVGFENEKDISDALSDFRELTYPGLHAIKMYISPYDTLLLQDLLLHILLDYYRFSTDPNNLKMIQEMNPGYILSPITSDVLETFSQDQQNIYESLHHQLIENYDEEVIADFDSQVIEYFMDEGCIETLDVFTIHDLLYEADVEYTTHEFLIWKDYVRSAMPMYQKLYAQRLKDEEIDDVE